MDSRGNLLFCVFYGLCMCDFYVTKNKPMVGYTLCGALCYYVKTHLVPAGSYSRWLFQMSEFTWSTWRHRQCLLALGAEYVAQTTSSTLGYWRLLHGTLFTRGRLFISTKTIMEGNVCNIQVLLRAAEFLERRERGECFMTTVSLQREEVGYC